MSGRKKKNVNIPMRAALILLCLTLISIRLTGGLYARYTAMAGGDDSARVAKFDVQVSLSDGIQLSNAQKSGEYTITVTNNSEVAIEYTLVLSFTEAVPSGLSAELDGNIGLVEGSSIKFPAKSSLAPGVSSNSHTLTLSVADGQWSDISKEMSGIKGEKNMSFTVDVTAAQLD